MTLRWVFLVPVSNFRYRNSISLNKLYSLFCLIDFTKNYDITVFRVNCENLDILEILVSVLSIENYNENGSTRLN